MSESNAALALELGANSEAKAGAVTEIARSYSVVLGVRMEASSRLCSIETNVRRSELPVRSHPRLTSPREPSRFGKSRTFLRIDSSAPFVRSCESRFAEN